MTPIVLDDAARTHLGRVYDCFLDVLAAGMQPTMTSVLTEPKPNWRDGEYDVLIEGQSYYGVMHEEIAAALAIAEKHSGQLFLCAKDGKLGILFPVRRAPGPGEESPAEEASREARGGKRVQRKRKAAA